MRPRLLLADDHMLMVEGLRSLLTADYDIVGVASNGVELLRLAGELRPDLILVDISMPEMDGLSSMRKVRAEWPDAMFLVVTQQVDRVYLHASLAAGARGYVVKQSAARELRTAIAEVLNGGSYISPSMTLPGKAKNILTTGVPGERLTNRQREVLHLVADGKSAKEIAAVLHISPKTVEFHKASLMNELGLHSTAELTRYAISRGIISA
jgi:DNA-binding NarL/FixJ family response regulator